MIYSISKAKRKHIGSLYRKKYRLRHMETVVEGERSVLAALNSGANVVDLFTTIEFSSKPELSKWSAKLGDAHHEITDQDFREISGLESFPGILAIVRFPEPISIRKISADRVILLDAIQDPGNLGTIIRTAAWLNFKQVLLSEGCVDHYSPKVIRASMGGFWEVDIVARLQLGDSLTELKKIGYHIVAADMDGENASASKHGKHNRLVLVLGNEASGLSDTARQMSNDILAIPRLGERSNPESLNVSSAAAILMNELGKGG